MILKSKWFWFETGTYLLALVISFKLLFVGYVMTNHDAEIALRGLGVGVVAGFFVKHLLDSFFRKAE